MMQDFISHASMWGGLVYGKLNMLCNYSIPNCVSSEMFVLQTAALSAGRYDKYSSFFPIQTYLKLLWIYIQYLNVFE